MKPKLANAGPQMLQFTFQLIPGHKNTWTLLIASYNLRRMKKHGVRDKSWKILQNVQDLAHNNSKNSIWPFPLEHRHFPALGINYN